MKRKTNTIRTTRFLWSLVLGLGLTLVLSWILMPHSTARAENLLLGLTIDLTYDAVWGRVAPGDVVTITRTSDGAYGAAEADGVGFFWTPVWRPNGQPADVASGDTIEVYVNGALAATILPQTITGQVDVLNDEVTGTIGGADGGTLVTVTLGIGAGVPGDYVPQVSATTDASGDFTTDFGAAGYDLGPHSHVLVAFSADSITIQDHLNPREVFQIRDFWSVRGYAAAGQTVTVTVKRGGTTLAPVTTVANWPHGDYDVGVQIMVDDIVEVDLGGGTVISTVAQALTTYPDAALDRTMGTCPSGEAVRAYTHSDPLGKYAEASATADGTGHYTASFSAHDLRADELVAVAFADTEGDEVTLTSYPPGVGAYLLPFWNGVWGTGDGPNLPYTTTLYQHPNTYVQTGTTSLNNQFSVNFDVDIAAGDRITLETPSWTRAMTVADASVTFDTANERVQGEADIPGWMLVDFRQWHSDKYPIHGVGYATATVASPFTAAFSNFDVRDSGSAFFKHYDANGAVTMRRYDMPYFQLTFADVQGRPPSAGETVTLTLSTATGEVLATTSDDQDGDPWRFALFFEQPEFQLRPGRWVTLTSASGWEAGIQVPDLIIVRADTENDLIWGQAPKSLVLVKHDRQEGWDERFVPVDDYALDQGFFGIDVQYDDYIGVTYQAPNGNRARGEILWPRMRVIYDQDQVWSDYREGHTFWITVTDSLGAVKATASDASVGGGGRYLLPGFEVHGPEWSPPNADLIPGDRVAFQADDGYRTEVRIGSIAADLDIAVNRVSGILYAPWFTQTVSGRVQNFDWWGMGGLDFVAEPDGGGFQVDVTPHDIVSGTELTLQYLEPDHDVVERSITAVEPSALGLKLGVNYGDDWVNGHCEAGHTIWITVTASDGSTVEATGVVTTGVVPGWDGGTGFEGNWIDWSTDPEIDPGDWVHARADNGEGKSVHVGTIRGQPNADGDDIQGTIDVPWLQDVVRVTCAGWGSAPGGAPRKHDLALPNSVDTYHCAWDPTTEWDLEPEQVIGVWYTENDGDEVFAPFRIEETWQIFLPLVLRGS